VGRRGRRARRPAIRRRGADERCRLPSAQQYWPDPYRADEDSEFRDARDDSDWPTTIAESFSNWLIQALERRQRKLKFDDDVYKNWRKELSKRMQQVAREKTGAVVKDVKGRVRQMKGHASGGTVASLKATMADLLVQGTGRRKGSAQGMPVARNRGNGAGLNEDVRGTPSFR